MNFPDNLKYSEDHEWILVEGNIGTIGITDYAQSELGDIVFVDIDPNISEVKVGDTLGSIEAVKTVSDLLSPCGGKVIEINSALADAPEDVNNDPYGKGWMIKIEISDNSDIDKLLDVEAYKNLIGQ